MTEESVRIPGPAAGRRGVVGTLRMLLELVKFEHSIFALPYAYIGALFAAASVGAHAAGVAVPDAPPGLGARAAQGVALHEPYSRLLRVSASGAVWPSWEAILWVTVAMVGARAFAFVVNRAVDKEIDARNPRTAGRAVPAGLIKAWELWVFALVMLAAYGVAVWRLHPVTWWLSPIPLVVFVVYPYLKRFTRLCHLWLGAALGLAPVGAWVAVTGRLSDWVPWVMGVAVALWTAGFDIIYATQDIEVDRRDGIHSVPADLGVAAGLRRTRWLHAATVTLLAAAGGGLGAGWAYFAGVALAAGLLAYENAIVSADDLSRVNAAFFTVNGIIAIVVFVGALADVAIHSV